MIEKEGECVLELEIENMWFVVCGLEHKCIYTLCNLYE